MTSAHRKSGDLLESKRRHRYHSPWKRGIYSCVLVASMLALGTVGFHRLEGLSYIDAFYLASMIATAQGPSQAPASPAGKIFASLMAFLSIGTVVASVGFLLGPFLGELWKIGHERRDSLGGP